MLSKILKKLFTTENFSVFIACGCKSEYALGLSCDDQTGKCVCLPGVIGEKCDQCPYRWVFIPDYGCTKCDSCIDNLLDDMDELALKLHPMVLEFDVSVFKKMCGYPFID